eukprot:s550_g13.t1
MTFGRMKVVLSISGGAHAKIGGMTTNSCDIKQKSEWMLVVPVSAPIPKPILGQESPTHSTAESDWISTTSVHFASVARRNTRNFLFDGPPVDFNQPPSAGVPSKSRATAAQPLFGNGSVASTDPNTG